MLDSQSMYAHAFAPVSPKRAKNLTFSERLLQIAESYCKTSDRKLTTYLEELLRADLREKGFPVDAPVADVMRYVEEQHRRGTKKKRK